MDIIAERLKELRKNHNLTKEDVAKKIHISRPTYTEYEIGKKRPSLDTLIKLADLFKVSLDYLTGRY